MFLHTYNISLKPQRVRLSRVDFKNFMCLRMRTILMYPPSFEQKLSPQPQELFLPSLVTTDQWFWTSRKFEEKKRVLFNPLYPPQHSALVSKHILPGNITPHYTHNIVWVWSLIGRISFPNIFENSHISFPNFFTISIPKIFIHVISEKFTMII
jgi:hypothetical protein